MSIPRDGIKEMRNTSRTRMKKLIPSCQTQAGLKMKVVPKKVVPLKKQMSKGGNGEKIKNYGITQQMDIIGNNFVQEVVTDPNHQ